MVSARLQQLSSESCENTSNFGIDLETAGKVFFFDVTGADTVTFVVETMSDFRANSFSIFVMAVILGRGGGSGSILVG